MCGVGWDNGHWENHLSQYLHWAGSGHDGNGGSGNDHVCDDNDKKIS